MKLSIAFAFTFLSSAAQASSLRGNSLEGEGGPLDILKCTFEAYSDEDKCSDSETADGGPCDYCKIDSQGQEAGLCVTPELADRMKSINPDVTCTEEREADKDYLVAGPDFSSFKCTLAAFTDEDKCSEVDASCEYCTLDGNEKTGICVNTEMASKMEQYSDKVSCSDPSLQVPKEIAVPKEFDVTGPLDVLKCTIQAFSDKDKCSEAKTADGSPCDYCKIDNQGQDAGLCVTPELADRMKAINPDVTCTEENETDDDFVMAGHDFSSFKCTLAAFTDQEKCSNVDDSCEYCTLDGDEKTGICVNTETASKMEQYSDKVSCSDPSKPQVDQVGIDWSDFKCSIKALDDIHTCMETKTEDGQWCEFCQVTGYEDDGGLCVSPSHAASLEDKSEKIICSHDSVSTYESFVKGGSNVNNPTIDCNLSGVDQNTCVDPSLVNGSDCVWCDAEIGGFCFPKSWGDTAGKFLKCTTEPEEESREPESHAVSGFFSSCAQGKDDVSCELQHDDKSDGGCVWCDGATVYPEFGLCLNSNEAKKVEHFMHCKAEQDDDHLYDDFSNDMEKSSSCLKIGLTSTDPDTCRQALDDTTGDHCVFCSTPNLPNVGLCMPSSFKGKDGRFYTCDGKEGDVLSIE